MLLRLRLELRFEVRTCRGKTALWAAACVAVSGLPGSGKSSLCRLLCGAFEESAWVNQDNFAATGRPRTAFLRALRASLQRALQKGGGRRGGAEKVNMEGHGVV